MYRCTIYVALIFLFLDNFIIRDFARQECAGPHSVAA